jgi:alkyldihydroxyacetonephosphate synthase
MKRWNGWGEDGVHVELAGTAARLLERRVGPGAPPRDAEWGEVVAAVPPSRLPAAPWLSLDAAERARHARGHSLPDWVALRSGRLGRVPDGVAFPSDGRQVREVLGYAREVGARVIPYGGGTSVVGHITPEAGEAPVLTVSLARLSRLQRFDETSRLATFGAGVRGPDLEAALRARGYTLGHFPQSWEWSTLGGWVATRSSGQQSLAYGRIEQLFAGGTLESPAGTLEMPPFPASAAGPDLREVVLGSEGRLGILTEATVRVSAAPAEEHFHAVFFPDWERGLQAARALAQSRLPLSLLRLMNPAETATALVLSGRESLPRPLGWLFRIRGVGAERCMLLFGVTGERAATRAARDGALEVAGEHGGVHVGRAPGRRWKRQRFRGAYMRNTLWEAGYAVDTVETALPWAGVAGLPAAIEGALEGALEEEERVHAFTHLSHVYATGSSVYTTFLFRLAPDPEETLHRWWRLKEAATRTILEHGGTISHQHGVGADHRPFLAAEKGALGIEALHAVRTRFDPGAMMNPGKLLPEEEEPCGRDAAATVTGIA